MYEALFWVVRGGDLNKMKQFNAGPWLISLIKKIPRASAFDFFHKNLEYGRGSCCPPCVLGVWLHVRWPIPALALRQGTRQNNIPRWSYAPPRCFVRCPFLRARIECFRRVVSDRASSVLCFSGCPRNTIIYTTNSVTMSPPRGSDHRTARVRHETL